MGARNKQRARKPGGADNMKLFTIASMKGGEPNINRLPHCGYVHAASVGNWGAYLFSGTAAQLQAINALSQVYGIVAVTESGGVKWAELENVISSSVRLKLQTWLNDRGISYTIPVSATYRQVVVAIYKRLNNRFGLAVFDVLDG